MKPRTNGTLAAGSILTRTVSVDAIHCVRCNREIVYGTDSLGRTTERCPTGCLDPRDQLPTALDPVSSALIPHSQAAKVALQQIPLEHRCPKCRGTGRKPSPRTTP